MQSSLQTANTPAGANTQYLILSATDLKLKILAMFLAIVFSLNRFGALPLPTERRHQISVCFRKVRN